MSGYSSVLLCRDLPNSACTALLGRYGLEARGVRDGHAIPGSYWGAPEAGLSGNRIYFRGDTPVHSLLHEASHVVCMTSARRRSLDTDAGGDDAEECAVCYLEVLLANHLAPFDAGRCLADMDAWGYSFREGSARAWFAGDGRDARRWLAGYGLIDCDRQPTWRLRV